MLMQIWTKYTIIWQPTTSMWQGTFGKMNNVGLNCVQAWVGFKKQLKLTFSPWTREIFVLFYAWTPPNPLQPRWVIHGFPHHHLRLLGLFTLLLALHAESCCSRPIQQPHSQKAALNWILTGSTCSETTSQRPQNSDKWGCLESSWFVYHWEKTCKISVWDKPEARVGLLGCFSLYFSVCSG